MHRRSVAFLFLLCTAGCLWRSYGTIMSVHLDVLTQTAAKLCAVVDSGRGVSAESMGEYVYPAQRGREFLRQFSGYRERRSYQQFTALLDRYETLVHEVDAQRAAGHIGRSDTPQLNQERDALQRMATDIRADLAQGN